MEDSLCSSPPLVEMSPPQVEKISHVDSKASLHGVDLFLFLLFLLEILVVFANLCQWDSIGSVDPIVREIC